MIFFWPKTYSTSEKPMIIWWSRRSSNDNVIHAHYLDVKFVCIN